MDRQPTLETERLLIRPMTEADREPLFEVASDPMVWEQHPAHDRWQRAVFDRLFDDGLASGGAHTIVNKASGDVIGSTRYGAYYPADANDAEDAGSVEIGWTFLAPKYWGKGYNHELKRAMLAHAFDSVGLVEFRVGDTNYRSRKALENIGAVRTTRYELERYDGKRVVHLYYEIAREDFKNGPLMAQAKGD